MSLIYTYLVTGPLLSISTSHGNYAVDVFDTRCLGVRPSYLGETERRRQTGGRGTEKGGKEVERKESWGEVVKAETGICVEEREMSARGLQ